jgi:methionyl-tRNA formyltransferase
MVGVERIVLITQDEPFFLASALERLLKQVPAGAKVVGCILLSPSPFGRRESLLGKLLRSYRIFGLRFVLRYAFRYVRTRSRPEFRVESVMKKYGVPAVRLDDGINSNASLGRIRDLAPDLLVSIAGNEIFRRPLLSIAPHGCLNLHSALLPKYRGLLPSFWVLKNGERESGVSVFEVDEGIDSGPILVQRKFATAGMTQEQLIERGKALGIDAVTEAIGMIMRGDRRRIKNDAAQATYFSFPKSTDVAAFRRAGARFY